MNTRLRPKLSVRPSGSSSCWPGPPPEEAAAAAVRTGGSGSGEGGAGEASGTSDSPEKMLRGLAYSDSAS